MLTYSQLRMHQIEIEMLRADQGDKCGSVCDEDFRQRKMLSETGIISAFGPSAGQLAASPCSMTPIRQLKKASWRR